MSLVEMDVDRKRAFADTVDRAAPLAVVLHDAMLPLAIGARSITQLLRERAPSCSGVVNISLHGDPLVQLDFGREQAIVLVPGSGDIVDRLATNFELLAAHTAGSAAVAPASERQQQPLRPLLWQWGLRTNHWRTLDAQLVHGAAVRLLRWPDFRVLGHDHDGFRICSLLLRSAQSTTQVAGSLEIDETVVYGFVHAAYLSGYARIEAPAPAGKERTAAPSMPGNLLSRMWRSLRKAH